MLNGSYVSFSGSNGTHCAFCNRTEISHILKETANFLLAADHAPLVEGHILLIPKHHYVCYGDVPTELDEELFALKREVQHFFTQYYAPVVFWEHGIFKQTVFHAHLHCFPWGTASYDLKENLHGQIVSSQEDIRHWYATHGNYFYMEDARVALLFAPEMDRYLEIIKSVFVGGVISQGGSGEWRPPEQRYKEGLPLIEAMIDKWRSFQEQGVDYVNKSSAR